MWGTVNKILIDALQKYQDHERQEKTKEMSQISGDKGEIMQRGILNMILEQHTKMDISGKTGEVK